MFPKRGLNPKPSDQESSVHTTTLRSQMDMRLAELLQIEIRLLNNQKKTHINLYLKVKFQTKFHYSFTLKTQLYGLSQQC